MSKCVCGHVKEHHIDTLWHCNWDECGCPQFIVDGLL